MYDYSMKRAVNVTTDNLSYCLSAGLNLLRVKYHLSMNAAAWQAGLSFAQWHQLETRRVKNPTIRTILKICNTFGVAIDDLIGRQVGPTQVERQEKFAPYFLNHDFYDFPKQRDTSSPYYNMQMSVTYYTNQMFLFNQTQPRSASMPPI